MFRLLLSLLLLSAATGLSAQSDTRWAALDTLDWFEAEARPDTLLLSLLPGGNFAEDAGPAHARPARYLRGRWTLDTTAATLTLGVDGMMASNLDRRYRRGRDYYVVYLVLRLSPDELVLRDVLTKRERRFLPRLRQDSPVDPLLNPSRKPKKDEPYFKLPDGWGGTN